ncbi:MAG: anti-phage-associated DUF1156 domain-containing protein [Alphaproteobacteria bacterium]
MLSPFSLKDCPSLIERAIPVQKISAEAQKERKAGASQTLTALGSYWKGRKPLVLVKACVLSALLPATDDPEVDISIFEQLMAMDVAGFGRRIALSKSTKLKASDVARALIALGREPDKLAAFFTAPKAHTLITAAEAGKLRWNRSIDWEDKAPLYAQALIDKPFEEWLELSDRAEQVDEHELYAPIWPAVNAHLKTSASSIPQLVEQLGMARFGKRPVVGDAFCGGGSVPFEAARLGCDVVASDLNPIACMLTWSALNLVGADAAMRADIYSAQREVSTAVDAEIANLGIEHNARGDRAKAYLYCLETRCPQTGYMVPMLPSRVVSRSRKTIAVLTPDHTGKRFDICIESNVSDVAMRDAEIGTVDDGDLVVTLNGETFRTPIKTIRGDRKDSTGGAVNALRVWEKDDFTPRRDDIYQERLYAIQWITKETLDASRQETYFASVTEEDLSRERVVEGLVRSHLSQWQAQGLVPDMPIEPGAKTDEPIRTRGWSYWHHLFVPRALLILAKYRSRMTAPAVPCMMDAINFASRLCRWETSPPRIAPDGSGKQTGGASDNSKDVFSNQALNTLYNYSIRAASQLAQEFDRNYPASEPVRVQTKVINESATHSQVSADIHVTDPPYADAIRYEEITEFFIAWLRKNPPEPFKDWIWDSRRALAIKGTGEAFRAEMIAAYRNLANHMPDNGLQIVMFTHQDAEVWADMAAIMWGAGLQVTAAWYVATETTSELKKGGYVQGTVLLILRKLVDAKAGYQDEITLEIKDEVARQIDNLTGLNDRALAHGRSENLFEDADLQMAGYAAALRVLTSYSRIDGDDMSAYVARPRAKGRKDPVKDMIDFAVDTANSQLIPHGFPREVWADLKPEERFYLKMVDLESAGLKKLDNYQNFAKAFRANWQPLMANAEPNAARLKNSTEFGKTQFGEGFGETLLRRVLWATFQLEQDDANGKAVLEELRTTPRYYERRDDLKAIAAYLSSKRTDEEAAAAKTLEDLIENERLG